MVFIGWLSCDLIVNKNVNIPKIVIAACRNVEEKIVFQAIDMKPGGKVPINKYTQMLPPTVATSKALVSPQVFQVNN